MLNNVDLNSQDSFYPQFDTCNDSAIGIMDTKEHQDVFMDAERAAPTPFAHGEFAMDHFPSVRFMKLNCFTRSAL